MVGDLVLSGWSGWDDGLIWLDLDDGDYLNLDCGMDLNLCYVLCLYFLFVSG